ncbi:TPA: hypothetical protein HA239_03950 [Candidatus Woesearchaeota archaeon]|nr:hypothetical protein QT06_C0001G0792 [archaeon GW2011_AR15]MBS3103428.1 hypothetical protein [Candidatus Woesearchaeota archaeon]HIH41545.1 hypothetical protein [Candidatus Woesearchaeota archaeon]
MKKKDRAEKNKKILVWFILIIFVLSTIGGVVVYYGGSGSDSFTISSSGKNFRFKLETDNSGNQYYKVSSGRDEFISYYPPSQILLDVSEDTKSLLRDSAAFYISFDPEQPSLNVIDYLRYDIDYNLPDGKVSMGAVTKETSLYQLPVVTCANATAETPVIIFGISNVTSIRMDNDYCINADFSTSAALGVRDALVYILNGVEIG